VARVVIVGAGIGGLATALLLGRAGRRVVVCERDPAPVPSSAEEMWSAWPRPGTPHARLGHTFLPGFRRLLEERAPDVLERVFAAGAPAVDFAADVPGGERRPGDEELTGIMCRRAVLEGVLRRAVEAEPTVQVRAGCDVVGLLAASSPLEGVPRVGGVRTRDGGTIRADAVVAAGGRTLPIRRWLESIGAATPAEVSEGCGFLTYTRYFRVRLRHGEDSRVVVPLTIQGDLGYMKYEIFGSDRCTFCIEHEVPVWDRELRRLHEPAAHLAAARALPEAPEWLDGGRSGPIGPVAAMGQERNVLREFVKDGRPLAVGLHVIGDARCQTNSVYAWGSGLALAQAVSLCDVFEEHRGDDVAQALAFETSVAAEAAGRHRLSALHDRACLRGYRGEAEWTGAEDGAELIESLVVPTAEVDPDVFRAVRCRHTQLDPADALERDVALLERVRALASRGPARSPRQTKGPTRESLLGAVAASGSPRMTG
jgi:2-polyprenyl-6-methoxyphenol hydroxylase-like FAD-dependent oxidoreductase